MVKCGRCGSFNEDSPEMPGRCWKCQGQLTFETESMTPTVSCICITQNRRFFLRQAITYFWRAAQHFEHLTGNIAELVILDGSSRSNEFLVDGWQMSAKLLGRRAPPIHYHHVQGSREHSKTGWFHNEAVERCKGEVIIQWDDDDWHDIERIFKQWETLKSQHEPSIAHTSKFFWYHLLEKKGCLSRTWYVGQGSVGAMLAYHRATWEKAPFRDVPQGEDNWFFSDHRERKTLFVDTKDPTFCVYIRHNRNGSPLVNASYEEAHTEAARYLFERSGDLEFYDELSELLPLDNWNRKPIVTSPYAQGQHPFHPGMPRRR
jgi:hypothetical protein